MLLTAKSTIFDEEATDFQNNGVLKLKSTDRGILKGTFEWEESSNSVSPKFAIWGTYEYNRNSWVLTCKGHTEDDGEYEGCFDNEDWEISQRLSLFIGLVNSQRDSKGESPLLNCVKVK